MAGSRARFLELGLDDCTTVLHVHTHTTWTLGENAAYDGFQASALCSCMHGRRLELQLDKDVCEDRM